MMERALGGFMNPVASRPDPVDASVCEEGFRLEGTT
jgi:hypothetical protein